MTSAMEEYMKAFAHLHFRVNGILYDSSVTSRESLEKLRDYEDVRDDDVVLWTYPKSGTHAAHDIAWKLVLDGDLDKYAKQSSELWFEVCPAEYILPHNSAAKFNQSLEDLSAAKSPRVISTHVHFDQLPKKLREGAAKIIYVSRNPKDVCVSLYEMAVKVFELSGRGTLEWSEYVELFLDGKDAIYGSWAAHLKDFYAVKERKNVLWVKYEDILSDIRGQVQRISSFIGHHLDAEAITNVAESCKFEAVKKQFPNSMFLRKGKAGAWKERFTVAQSEMFDQKIRQDLGEIASEVLS